MKTWLSKLNGAEFKIMRLQETPPAEQPIAASPEGIDAWLRPLLATSLRYNPDQENLIVILFSVRLRPIGFEVISNGSLDTLLVHAREVFKPAIVLGAYAIAIVHNHPSGDPTPSDADIKVTRDLIRAGQLLKIDVLDHVVLGKPTPERPTGFVSLREMGYFSL